MKELKLKKELYIRDPIYWESFYCMDWEDYEEFGFTEEEFEYSFIWMYCIYKKQICIILKARIKEDKITIKIVRSWKEVTTFKMHLELLNWNYEQYTCKLCWIPSLNTEKMIWCCSYWTDLIYWLYDNQFFSYDIFKENPTIEVLVNTLTWYFKREYDSIKKHMRINDDRLILEHFIDNFGIEYSYRSPTKTMYKIVNYYYKRDENFHNSINELKFIFTIFYINMNKGKIELANIKRTILKLFWKKVLEGMKLVGNKKKLKCKTCYGLVQSFNWKLYCENDHSFFELEVNYKVEKKAWWNDIYKVIDKLVEGNKKDYIVKVDKNVRIKIDFTLPPYRYIIYDKKDKKIEMKNPKGINLNEEIEKFISQLNN